MTRQEANRKIIEFLSQMVERYPDWRFGQILMNSNALQQIDLGKVRDPFYDESTDTLNNILRGYGCFDQEQ